MTQSNDAGSLEALVPADKGGSSGCPGGAQAPVPADTCDLRARIDYLSEVLWSLRRKLEPLQAAETSARLLKRELIRKLKRRQDACRRERPHQLRAEKPNDMTNSENSEQAQTSLAAACGGSANFVATEPRQITGAPFYYYGYTGKLDAGQHLIWNSLARCCTKKHRGAKAATTCATKAARRRNSPNVGFSDRANDS